MSRYSFFALLSPVIPSLRRFWPRIVIGLLALVVVDILQLFIPRLLRHGVNLLQAEGGQPELLPLSLAIVGIAALVVVLRFCWRLLIIGFSRMLECAIRDTLFRHFLTMDAPFFSRNSPGELMAHSTNDLNAVQMTFGMGLIAAVDASVMLGAALTFMAMINLQLTLCALLPMPLLAVSTQILAGKLHRRFENVQQQFAELTEFSRSSLAAIRLIKAYTMERVQEKGWQRRGEKYVQANIKVGIINGIMQPISTLIGNLGMLSVFFFGGSMVIKGQISLGDFVAFISYLYMIIWPIMAIGWVTNLLQRGRTSLARIKSLLEQQSQIHIEQGLAQHTESGVVVADLSFRYQANSPLVLRHVSLSFANKTYGITGPTGSGKSTLCRLLCHLYPLPNGTIFYQQRDYNAMALEELREKISYVSQEPILFSETVAYNIGLGQASEEQIIDAARQAAIHEAILNLPKGYKSEIGERGVTLSGGQKQRLALARALLHQRPILLIDDGLSAVDVETEHAIFRNLQKRLRTCTIIVSNRVKLLSLTDEIIILDEGRVAAQGSHEQLLEYPFYRAMREKQQAETP